MNGLTLKKNVPTKNPEYFYQLRIEGNLMATNVGGYRTFFFFFFRKGLAKKCLLLKNSPFWLIRHTFRSNLSKKAHYFAP